MPKEHQQNHHYYRSLIRNMVLIMIVVSCSPLVLIGGIVLSQFHEAYHEKVLAHLKEVIQKHEQHIDSFLNERMGNIRMLAEGYSFDQLRDESFLQRKLLSLKDEFGNVFVDLGVITLEGVQIAYAGPFHLSRANYSEAEWFNKALQKDYFISDVFLGIRGLPHFIISVKQGDGKGAAWLLRSTVDFEAFSSLVGNIRMGETGFAFILNKKGEFQTKPQREALLGKEFLLNFPVENLARDLITVFERKDRQGRTVIYVVAPLKKGEWMLVYQQNLADALSDFYRARRLVFVIFLVGGVGVVIMAFLLSKRMVNRIARADREKEMMNEQVIETGKLAALGELAAGIAHEINNPVAIMVEEAGWIADLLEDEEFQESENLKEFKRALQQIKTQGTRCKQITHKLLSFARKTEPKIHGVRLEELIEDVVALSQQRAKYSMVQMTVKHEDELPTIYISASEFQQVLLNLINNALDAMTASGGRIDITTRIEDNFVVIEVADTGQGIPPANLPRIFDPFFTTKAVGKGTGLGLSICYGIIKKMGGEINVRSAVGVGTVFTVRIPLKREAPDETSRRA
jgi:two-component system NtrC family sensor kinase